MDRLLDVGINQEMDGSWCYHYIFQLFMSETE